MKQGKAKTTTLLRRISDFGDYPGSEVDRVVELAYEECDKKFIRSIRRHGIKMPIDFGETPRGGLILWNGHHRFAVAHMHGMTVPYTINGHSETSSSKYVNSLGEYSDY